MRELIDPITGFNISYIEVKKDVEKTLTYLSKFKDIGFDLETLSANPLMGREIRTFQFGVLSDVLRQPHRAFVVSMPLAKEFQPFMENFKPGFVGHSLKFEMETCLQNGTSFKVADDTIVLAYHKDPDAKKSLNHLSQILYEFILPSWEEVSEYEVDANEFILYGGRHAILPLMIRDTLDSKGVIRSSVLYQLDKALISVVAEIELRGLGISLDFFNKKCDEYEEKLKEDEVSLASKLGVSDINSPTRVGESLLAMGVPLSRTDKSGQVSTAQANLKKVAGKYGIVKELLKYRQEFKLWNSFLKSLPKYVSEKTGRIHTELLTTHVPCLTDKSFLLTKNGFLSIKDVNPNDKVWTISGWDRVTEWKKIGKADVYRAVFSNGLYLEGTFEHPVMLEEGISCFLGELKKDDKIKYGFSENLFFNAVEIEFEKPSSLRTPRSFSVFPRNVSLELCKLFGFIAGDGSIAEDKVRLVFWEKDIDLIEYYVRLFKGLFGVKPCYERSRKDHTVQVSFCSVIVASFFKYFGIKDDSVPDLVKKSGPLGILNFIAGYFDSDGSVCLGNSGKVDIRISSICCNRLEECAMFLSMIGYHPVLRKKQAGQKYLYFQTADSWKFYREIPFISMRKREFIVKSLRKATPRISDVFSLRVSEVKKVGRRTVYDISLEKQPWFCSNGAITHNTRRFASKAPNLQQIPKSVRGGFIPREGFYYIGGDYKGIEFRLFLNLSGDSDMCKKVSNGYDPHTATAAVLHSVPEESVTREQRDFAKTFNFAAMYGASPYGLAYNLNISPESAKKFRDGFFTLYSKGKSWIDNRVKNAYATGRITNIFGYGRYLDLHSEDTMIRKKAYKSIINSEIQSTAADILRFGLVRTSRRLKEKFGDDAYIIMTTHDDILVEVKKTIDPKEVIKVLIDGMCFDIPGFELPMEIEFGVGDSWGTLKPITESFSFRINLSDDSCVPLDIISKLRNLLGRAKTEKRGSFIEVRTTDSTLRTQIEVLGVETEQ